MWLNWQERLQQTPFLSDMAYWPYVAMDHLTAARRKRFLRNQQIVSCCLAGTSQTTLAKTFGLSQPRINQLLDRCLAGEEDQPPALMAGLLPNVTLVNSVRHTPIPTLAKPQGTHSAFKWLLDHVPGLRQGLNDMIQTKLKDADYAQRLTPQAFHGEFKRLLAEAHWPQDHYPYTHVSLAYQSVRRYLHQRREALLLEKEMKHTHRTPIATTVQAALQPLRAIQIDEHKLDSRSRLHLALNDQLIPLPLPRVTVLVAIDVDTQCVLGYYLTPTESPAQQDMLRLLDYCLHPYPLLTLQTPGLVYDPGASFPCQLPLRYPISFGTVHMDNAWMHRAKSVIQFLGTTMGATIHLGRPHAPLVRRLIEGIFDYIEDHATHRVASTAGSYPTDPQKESRKNAKRVPVISYQTLDEALAVILTHYNVTPKPELGHASPLAVFQALCQVPGMRYVPALLQQQWHPMICGRVVAIKRDRKDHGALHINYMYARYTGRCLLKARGQHTRIRIAYNVRDLRNLQAFTLDGQLLGDLTVQSAWRRYPHSLAMRQYIHRHAKIFRLNMRDPLASYFRYLLDNLGKPKINLAVLRVYLDFKGNETNLNGLFLPPDEAPLLPPSPGQGQRFEWHPGLANHRD